jgi:hypothetical protein
MIFNLILLGTLLRLILKADAEVYADTRIHLHNVSTIGLLENAASPLSSSNHLREISSRISKRAITNDDWNSAQREGFDLLGAMATDDSTAAHWWFDKNPELYPGLKTAASPLTDPGKSSLQIIYRCGC